MVPRAASRADRGPRRSTGARRVYRQSQGERPLPGVPVNEIASFVVPAGVFVAVTFGMPLCFGDDGYSFQYCGRICHVRQL